MEDKKHTPTEENILANKHDPHVAYAMAKAREILVDGSLQWQIETIATLLLRANINSYALNSAPQVNESQERSIWQEVCYIINDSDSEESAINRLMKLYAVDRKNIDKTIKP